MLKMSDWEIHKPVGGMDGGEEDVCVQSAESSYLFNFTESVVYNMTNETSVAKSNVYLLKFLIKIQNTGSILLDFCDTASCFVVFLSPLLTSFLLYTNYRCSSFPGINPLLCNGHLSMTISLIHRVYITFVCC